MRPLQVSWLGTVPYKRAWALQKALHEARAAERIGDQLLLLEHPHTLTVGTRSGKPGTRWEHLLAPREQLEARGVELLEVDRGGDVTWHGPGQLVGYPIIHLGQFNRDVGGYVRNLEATVLRSLNTLGITADRMEGYPGVWIDGTKISAIGARVRKWTTLHGFSFNLRGALEGFDWITPCGLQGRGVTSVQEQVPGPIPDDDELRQLVIDAFCASFDMQAQVQTISADALQESIPAT